MKLLTYRDGISTRAGVRVDGGGAPTLYPDLLALVRDGEVVAGADYGTPWEAVRARFAFAG